MRNRNLLVAAVLIASWGLSARAAWADAATAGACASRLAPGARALYDAVAPRVRPGSHLRRLLRTQLAPRVRSGQLDRTQAIADARAAAACLKRLQR